MEENRILIDRGHDAVLAVDVTPTFMPGGGLAVPGGDEIVPVVEDLAGSFKLRFATEDVHPFGHVGFAGSYQGVEANGEPLTLARIKGWAPNRVASPSFDLAYLRWYLEHCRGQQQMPWSYHGLPHWEETRLDRSLTWLGCAIFSKGEDPKCDSYSAFTDNLGRSTGFDGILRGYGVTRLFVAGLALNFCVGFTALDAADLGFEVVLVEDATRSVPIPGSVEAMIDRLRAKDIRFVASKDIVAP